MKYIVFIAILTFLASCSTNKSYHITENRENSKLQETKPYVLLISIDGYRWDYTDKYQPTFLSHFKKTGASVKSLRPSFPTKTFPNHLSLATGRYPMKHGIVGNSFYAPTMREDYSLKNREAVTDPRFYTAKPIWVLAEEQSLLSATYFWPGSEAKIEGILPSYYLTYKHDTPHDKRINTILEWFKLPSKKRPHLATLYFSDVDSAGHKYGPDSKEVKLVIEKVDQSIEKLSNKLKQLKLPINIIIVSDHGMSKVDPAKFEIIADNELKEEIELSYKVVGSGPIVQFYKNDQPQISPSSLLERINEKAEHFKCYPKDKTPKKLNFRGSDRIGDFVCIANKDWSIGLSKGHLPKGNHGWSQFGGMDMHAILYAKGPLFKNSFEQETINNIDLFPLLAKILGLKVDVEIDGDFKNSAKLLK